MMSRFLAFSVLISLSMSRIDGGVIAEPNHGVNETLPVIPLEEESRSCRLDLSEELFRGVDEACGRNLDRGRCCPVLAAWLFAAHARYALQIPNTTENLSSTFAKALPVIPDDSQKCVHLLQRTLASRNIKIPRPNATCDTALCFCGIRLHHITSLSCPAAFNVSSGLHAAAPTFAVRNLEKSCSNSSYTGCTKCLSALQKVKNTNRGKNRRKEYRDERGTKILNRDCQLMGLTWLLARDKTTYISTVSAVLRAILYSSHLHEDFHCSPDQENMPLAVDSLLQFQKTKSNGSLQSRLAALPFIPFLASLILLAI